MTFISPYFDTMTNKVTNQENDEVMEEHSEEFDIFNNEEMENPREGGPSSLNSNTDPDSDEVEGSDLPNGLFL